MILIIIMTPLPMVSLKIPKVITTNTTGKTVNLCFVNLLNDITTKCSSNFFLIQQLFLSQNNQLKISVTDYIGDDNSTKTGETGSVYYDG